MNEKLVKKQRQIIRKWVTKLLSNMDLFDRIRFVFTGNYYIPLQRTLNKMKRK